MLLRPLLCAFTFSVTLCFAQRSSPFGAHLDGRPLAQLAPPGAKAVALFFVASDCPVSNRTFPEMQRLIHAFIRQGVRFWFVYPNATEKADEVRAHQLAFDAADADSAITDPGSRLASLTHALVTPEISILIPKGSSWKPVYTGRIDDRFVRIGLERPAPTQFLAELALTELLAGRPVTSDTGTPVGCAIIPQKATRR